MRELNNKEIQNVSGGIDLTFFGGLYAGVENLNFHKTMKWCGLVGLVEGGLAGAYHSTLLILPFAPVGAFVGVCMGYLGYTIGNIFAEPAPSSSTN